jgi:hypothetical protein
MREREMYFSAMRADIFTISNKSAYFILFIQNLIVVKLVQGISLALRSYHAVVGIALIY